MDLVLFPFDEQVCFLKFGSWTYHGFALDLQIDRSDSKEPSADLSTYISNGEWELISAPAKRFVSKFECCPEPYPTIKFYLHIKRRSLYYLFNIILPTMLISFMTLLTFILPPTDMSEKIGLQMTILLSVCFFLTILSEFVPTTSESIPLLGVFFSAITIIVSMSTCSTVLVLNLRYRQISNHKMSNTCLSQFKLENDQEESEINVAEEWMEEIYSFPQMQLELSGKVGEGLFLEKRCSLHEQYRETKYERSINKCIELIKEEESDLKEFTLSAINVCRVITNQIKRLRKRTDDNKNRKMALEEWQFAAQALDRVYLLMFSIVLLSIVGSIFLLNPHVEFA